MTESSFDKIKKIIKIVGGKVIIVEDGKPTMVVINVDEYIDFKKTEDSFVRGSGFQEKDVLKKTDRVNDRVNRDIDVWKGRQEERALRQFEIENRYQERKKNEKRNSQDNGEIIIERL